MGVKLVEGCELLSPPRQHRRHALADHPSRLDHPPPARRGAADRGRRRPGRGPPVDRHRDRRRHHRRPRPGAESRGVGFSGRSQNPDLGHKNCGPGARAYRADRCRPPAPEAVSPRRRSASFQSAGRRTGAADRTAAIGAGSAVAAIGSLAGGWRKGSVAVSTRPGAARLRRKYGAGAGQGCGRGRYCVSAGGGGQAPVAVGQRELEHAPSPPLEEAPWLSLEDEFLGGPLL